MIPSATRVVLYHFKAITNDGFVMKERPALITSVVDGNRVNLHVFWEPSDIEETDPTGGDLDFKPFRGNVDACHADPFRPPTPNTWSWPLLV